MVILIVDIVLFFGTGRSDSDSAADASRAAVAPDDTWTVDRRTAASSSGVDVSERTQIAATTATAITTATATTTPSAPTSATGTATATSTAAPADQGSSAAGGAVRLPESGPGIDEPGVLLIAVPDATGSFEVTERLRLARPTATLTVAPLDVSRAGAIFRDADVTATDVQVSAGDQPVVVPSTVERALTLAVAGDRFTLRYRLDGVTVRSRPSTAARALAAIGPLSSRLPAELPVVVIVSGPTVLGINCPLRPLAAQSCGIGGAPRWTLRTARANAALAMVQFDLPVD